MKTVTMKKSKISEKTMWILYGIVMIVMILAISAIANATNINMYQ